MKNTVAVALLSTAALLCCCCSGASSQLSRVPAHDLAPTGIPGIITDGNLDGDGDDDISQPWNQFWNVGCPGPPVWQPEEDVFPGTPPNCQYVNSMSLGDCDAAGDLDAIYGCWECCSLRMIWNVGTPHEPV